MRAARLRLRGTGFSAAAAYLLACVLVLGLTLAPNADAGTTFTVTKTADTNDGNCNADCSLREAVVAANALPGANTITLPAAGVPYTLTISGASEDAAATGDLDITDDLTIVGAGASTTVVDGNGSVIDDRVFSNSSGVTASVSGVTIQNGKTSGGGPSAGGGIRNEGMLTLTNNTVSGNSSNVSAGGGIYNTGILAIANSTISGNTSKSGGGGISNTGTLTIANSTISGNTTADFGGGVWNFRTTNLYNATIANNVADSDNDDYGVGGGIFNYPGATVNLADTLITGNGNCCVVFNISAPDDCSGSTIMSQGYNLIQEISGCTIQNDDSTNLKGVDPALSGLADNGGPTLTMALQPGSPAIDAGLDEIIGGCGYFNDQRGYVRPVDGDGNGSAICDIGAFEYGASPPPTPTPSPSPTPTPSPSPTESPTPTPTHSPTPTSTHATARIQGDINCDGVVDEEDFTFLIRYFAGLNDGTQPDPCPDLGGALPAAIAFLWGDVDCANGLNPLDALYVFAHNAGVELPHPGCPAIGSPLT